MHLCLKWATITDLVAGLALWVQSLTDSWASSSHWKTFYFYNSLVEEVIKDEEFSKKPWLSFIPSFRKWAIPGQSVLAAYLTSIFHSVLLTEFFEIGNMSSWKKKSVLFQISLTPRGGHVIEVWLTMRKTEVQDFWKHFCFPAQMLCFLAFPFAPSSCLECTLHIWILQIMRKRPGESQRPWPWNLQAAETVIAATAPGLPVTDNKPWCI